MRLHLALLVAAFLTLSSDARAGVIVGPDSVSASVPDLNAAFAIGNLINQSGISANYTSGVTDFDTFVGSTTLTANPSASNNTGWASTTNNSFPVNIDFDFGAALDLTRLVVWNDTDVQAIGNFEVFASADASFTSLNSLGSFTGAPQAVGTLGQVFDFADANTRYIRVQGSPVTDVNGLINIGEFAFESGAGAQIPEPSSCLVFALLGAGEIGCRRQRKLA